MKLLIIGLLFLLGFQAQGQDERRAGLLENKEQSIGLATGVDYSIAPLIVQYQRGVSLFNYQYPIQFGAAVAIPIFAFDLNDMRISLSSDMTFLKIKKFELRGGINPLFVLSKTQTEVMSSLGADFHIFAGYTNPHWNFGVEMLYNQIFSTYITHSEKYKQNVYAGVVDGWYRNTAANIQLGFLVLTSIKKFNIYLRAGISRTALFNDYLFVPTIYGHLGANYRF